VPQSCCSSIDTFDLSTRTRDLTAFRLAESCGDWCVHFHPTATQEQAQRSSSIHPSNRNFLSIFSSARLATFNEASTMAESMEGVVTADQPTPGGQDKIITGMSSLIHHQLHT